MYAAPTTTKMTTTAAAICKAHGVSQYTCQRDRHGPTSIIHSTSNTALLHADRIAAFRSLTTTVSTRLSELALSEPIEAARPWFELVVGGRGVVLVGLTVE